MAGRSTTGANLFLAIDIDGEPLLWLHGQSGGQGVQFGNADVVDPAMTAVDAKAYGSPAPCFVPNAEAVLPFDPDHNLGPLNVDTDIPSSLAASLIFRDVPGRNTHPGAL